MFRGPLLYLFLEYQRRPRVNDLSGEKRRKKERWRKKKQNMPVRDDNDESTHLKNFLKNCVYQNQ